MLCFSLSVFMRSTITTTTTHDTVCTGESIDSERVLCRVSFTRLLQTFSVVQTLRIGIDSSLVNRAICAGTVYQYIGVIESNSSLFRYAVDCVEFMLKSRFYVFPKKKKKKSSTFLALFCSWEHFFDSVFNRWSVARNV